MIQVFIDVEGWAEGPSTLECVSCHETLWDGEAIDLSDLVGRLQAHEYGCRGKLSMLVGKYCGVCGEQLQTAPGMAAPRCVRCNLLVPAAMQTSHEMQWVKYADMNFQPACTCGWKSQTGHALEKNAWEEWDRHPKGNRPRLRVVPNA